MRPLLPERLLVILRHAHRSLEHAGADNGLSKKGKKQAKRIRDFFRKEFGQKERPVIYSSPKRRCLETAAPLAKTYGTKVAPLEDLREQGVLESRRHFRTRVATLVNRLRRTAPPLTVVSAHGDWIPAALEILTGARASLKKGGWAQVTLARPPSLTNLIQKLP